MGITIEGRVEPAFGDVERAFGIAFDSGLEVGAGLCVYHRGRPVVDIWAGHSDRDRSRPWEHDTLAGLASTTKGLAATAAHLLVERGVLDLDARVTDYWPEFASGEGMEEKSETTVRMILSHRSGVVALDHRPLTTEDVVAYRPVIEALETALPVWRPGTDHGYHGLTIGHLLSELIRRTTGLTVGRFLDREICGPYELDCHIGLPESQLPRVATIVAPAPDSEATLGKDIADATEMYQRLQDPTSLLYRATFGSLNVGWESVDDPRWTLAEAPSSDGTASAAGLARLFAMLASEVEGERILAPSTVDAARTVHSDGVDRVLGIQTTWGLGYALPGGPLFQPIPGAGGAFGHGGATGSLALADPDHELALAYVPNRMAEAIEGGDLRVWRLVDTVYRCL